MSKVLTLGDVASIVDCEHKTAPISENGSYFAVGTPAMKGNLISFAEARRIDEGTFLEWTTRLRPVHGDLLLAREAPVGPVVRIPPAENVAPGQRTVLIRPDDNQVDGLFLFYLLISPMMQRRMGTLAAGSTVAHLNVADVRNLQLPPLPHPATQRGIGEVLGALDDKIAANRKISDSSNALIAFQVAARLQIATPLSEAPIHFIFGEAFSGAQFSEPGQGRPLIRIRDLKSQQCQVWTTEQRPRETAVSPGDLLIGMDAEFRATRWSGPKGVLNQRVMMAKSDELGHPITQIALRETLARIERSKSGTTVIHLNKSDLDREFVMLPAAGDLKELRGIVDPLWARATLAEVESRTLTAVRDELLPQLMSGRITVKDAERRVEEEI